MPIKGCTVLESKLELVTQMKSGVVSVTELCRRYRVSRKTAYKYLQRYAAEGEAGLLEKSRKPKSSPKRTSPQMERKIVELRKEHHWGGKKLRKLLENAAQEQKMGSLEVVSAIEVIPAVSTITRVMHRHELIVTMEGQPRGPWKRFEKEHPNEMWQMDFKGHFEMGNGNRCHPLTIVDDHSRFCVLLKACGNEQMETVKFHLIEAFRMRGMPWKMLMDNGSPWGNSAENPWTHLTVWLTRLGIRVLHGRPYHPQTQGKEERFHRTLKEELLDRSYFADLIACENGFGPWREKYNHVRPHEAIGLMVPASRYRPSPRSYPEVLPKLEYDAGYLVRKVDPAGNIGFQNRFWRIGQGFAEEFIGLRPSAEDDVWEVCLGLLPIGVLRIHDKESRRMERASTK